MESVHESMRITHISTVHPLNDTRIWEKQCSGLALKGYDVHLVIPTNACGAHDNVTVHPLPIPRNRAHRFVRTSVQAVRVALSTHADIYHIHDPELILIGLFIRMKGSSVVYDMHENVPKQILNKAWIPRSLRWVLAKLVKGVERISLNRFYVVFAEASYRKDYAWIERQETVLNYPLIERLTAISSCKRKIPTIGYIGGVTEGRGVITTVAAIKSLRDKGYEINFECIGRVDAAVKENLAVQTGLSEGWISMPGRLAPEQGWRMISECHVGLALLHPIGNYIDSYPTKMFEYMALGLPVIASDFPLYRDVVATHDCGVCVDPLDVKSIEEAMREMIDRKDMAASKGVNGFLAVEKNYDWRTQLEKLEQVYADNQID